MATSQGMSQDDSTLSNYAEIEERVTWPEPTDDYVFRVDQKSSMVYEVTSLLSAWQLSDEPYYLRSVLELLDLHVGEEPNRETKHNQLLWKLVKGDEALSDAECTLGLQEFKVLAADIDFDSLPFKLDADLFRRYAKARYESEISLEYRYLRATLLQFAFGMHGVGDPEPGHDNTIIKGLYAIVKNLLGPNPQVDVVYTDPVLMFLQAQRDRLREMASRPGKAINAINKSQGGIVFDISDTPTVAQLWVKYAQATDMDFAKIIFQAICSISLRSAARVLDSVTTELRAHAGRLDDMLKALTDGKEKQDDKAQNEDGSKDGTDLDEE